MRRIVEVFNTGDVSSLDSLVSPKYVDHQGIGGSKIFGTSGFASLVTRARQGHPLLRVEILEISVDGDRVTARLIWTEADYDASRQTIDTIRFSDGLAVEHWGERLD